MNSQHRNNPDSAHDPGYQVLKLPVQVQHMLKRLREERALLVVTVPGTDITFSSALLESSPEQDYIVLDEFVPRERQTLIREGAQLGVHTTSRGTKFNFECLLRESGHHQGAPFYVASFPKELRYLEKRAAFRVQLGVSSELGVSLRLADGAVVTGILEDISVEGACIRTLDPAGTGVLEEAEITECAVDFPGASLTCPAYVRNVRQGNRPNLTRLGVRFTDMNGAQRRLLERTVAALEREYLRKVGKLK